MGHNISAIIGQQPINEQKAKEYGLAVAFEGDFVIVLLDIDSMYYWSQELGLSIHSSSDNLEWACELSFHLAKELGIIKYAIIQTNYFGGIGEQCASLYENGNIVVEERDINEILNSLGVKRGTKRDEFEELNLDKYRDSEYWYKDFGLPDHWHTKVIKGFIPKR